MTLYMLFAGLGMLIDASAPLAETAIAAVSGAHINFPVTNHVATWSLPSKTWPSSGDVEHTLATQKQL